MRRAYRTRIRRISEAAWCQRWQNPQWPIVSWGAGLSKSSRRVMTKEFTSYLQVRICPRSQTFGAGRLKHLSWKPGALEIYSQRQQWSLIQVSMSNQISHNEWSKFPCQTGSDNWLLRSSQGSTKIQGQMSSLLSAMFTSFVVLETLISQHPGLLQITWEQL